MIAIRASLFLKRVTVAMQAAFCFTEEHPTCPRYVEPVPEDLSTRAPLRAAPKATFERSARFPLWAIVLAGLVGILVVFAVFHFFLSSALRPGYSQPDPQPQFYSIPGAPRSHAHANAGSGRSCDHGCYCDHPASWR